MLPVKDENPVSHRAWVTFLLIAVNVAVFVGLQGMNDPQRASADFALEWAAIPCEVVTGDGLTELELRATFLQGIDEACDLDPQGREAYPDKPVRVAVILSMFMHAGWLHLAGNCWFLFIFGNNIEDHLGPVRYVLFYLVGGMAATAVHIAAAPDSTIPVVGASGAVAAVMGTYAVWFPNAPIRTIVVVLLWNIRAKWWLGFWFVSQFFIGADSGVAWTAHAGGFVFGALVGLFLRMTGRLGRRRPPPSAQLASWDSTGGIGRGPYARPTRIVPRRQPPPGPTWHARAQTPTRLRPRSAE